MWPICLWATDTITLTDYSLKQVWQRDLRDQDYDTDIQVTGTYTGDAPASVQARVQLHGTTTTIVDWTTLLSCTVNSGGITGTLADVPQSTYDDSPCWYDIDIRCGDQTAIYDEGANKWGVGIQIFALGQSNMMFGCDTCYNNIDYGGTDTPDEHTSQYAVHSYTTAGDSCTTSLQTPNVWRANNGNLAVNLANEISDSENVPVAIIQCAVGGSALGNHGYWAREAGYWLDTSEDAYYDRFQTALALLNPLDSAGSRQVEFVIWDQGESDAWDSAGAYYSDDLDTFYAMLESDIRTDVPFIIAQIGRDDFFAVPAGWQNVQMVQLATDGGKDNFCLGSTTFDLPGRSGEISGDTTYLHRGPTGYRKEGQRFAQAINYLLGHETYYRGPRILGFELIDSTHIDVYISHRGGTDFTPTSGITGFQVNNGGSGVSVSSAARQAYNTIRLTTAETSWAETVTVYYMYGDEPTITGAVHDNTVLALPLEKGVTTTQMTEPVIYVGKHNINCAGGGVYR